MKPHGRPPFPVDTLLDDGTHTGLEQRFETEIAREAQKQITHPEGMTSAPSVPPTPSVPPSSF